MNRKYVHVPVYSDLKYSLVKMILEKGTVHFHLFINTVSKLHIKW